MSDEYVRVHFTETSTYFEDRALQSDTWYGLAGWGMTAAFFKFSEGLWAGTGNELDPVVLAGDLIGSIWLAPVSITRDAVNSADDAVQGAADGTDAANLALAGISVAAAVSKKKLGPLAKLDKLGRLLKRGGGANATVSRILMKELRRTLFQGDLQKVKRIAELAAAAPAAVQAIATLVQAVGNQEQSVEDLNNILEWADDGEQVVAALDELESEMPPADLRLLLNAAAPTEEELAGGGGVAPGASGTPAGALHAVSATVLLPRITAAALWGMRAGQRVLAAQQLARRARAYMHVVIRYHSRAEALDIFRKIRNNESLPKMYRVVSQLAHPNVLTRAGARRVLEMAEKLRDPQTAQAVAQAIGAAGARVSSFEVRQGVRFMRTAGGRIRSRLYDMVLDVNGTFYRCEVKLWRTFPPNQEALDAALDQFRRDVVAHLTEPDIADRGGIRTLRWILPDALKGQKGAIIQMFQKELTRPSVFRALKDAGFDPRARKEALATVSGVLQEIFQFAP